MDETTPAGTPEPDGMAAPAAAEAADGNASPARDEEWERLRAVLPECRGPEDVPEPARRLAEAEGLPLADAYLRFLHRERQRAAEERERQRQARFNVCASKENLASGPNRSRNRRPSAGRLKRRCGRKGGGGARDAMALSEDGVPASPYATGERGRAVLAPAGKPLTSAPFPSRRARIHIYRPTGGALPPGNNDCKGWIFT